MDVNKKLLEQIVPTFSGSNWKDREWFNNDSILSKLTQEELKSVEDLLIEKLKTDCDSLVPETLVKLKSLGSIPVILEKINLMKDPFERIRWASYIDDLKKGNEVAEKIAYEDFKRLKFIYEVQGDVFILFKKVQ